VAAFTDIVIVDAIPVAEAGKLQVVGIVRPELLGKMATRDVGCEPPQLPDECRFYKKRLCLGEACGDDSNDGLQTALPYRLNSLRLLRIGHIKYVGGFAAALALTVVEFFKIARVDLRVDIVFAHLQSLTGGNQAGLQRRSCLRSS
jgi:hypothetical protein